MNDKSCLPNLIIWLPTNDLWSLVSKKKRVTILKSEKVSILMSDFECSSSFLSNQITTVYHHILLGIINHMCHQSDSFWDNNEKVFWLTNRPNLAMFSLCCDPIVANQASLLFNFLQRLSVKGFQGFPYKNL